MLRLPEIFRRKPGPILQWSRLCHSVLALGLTVYGGHLGGEWAWLRTPENGCGVGAVAALLIAVAWEISNRWMPGKHRYADVLDLLAFVAGVGAGLALWVAYGPTIPVPGP